MLNLKSLEEEKFFKFYKFLFEDERFEKISIEGKILYSLILERYKLSVEREIKDENGYYIIFKIKEIQKILNCGNQKAGKILNELELVGLIDKRKQGVSNPDLIYLKNFKVKCENQTCENHTYNKTDISKTNIQSGALAPDNKGGVKITTQKSKEIKICSIPLKNGDYYKLYEEQIELYKELYPKINIEQEIRNIIGWNLANVSRRKTLKGIKRHINFWLQKASEKVLENPNIENKKLYEPKYSKDDFFSV